MERGKSLDIFRKPKYYSLPATPRATDIPENLWVRCQKCRDLAYIREFEQNLKVCPKCGHHHRMSSQERISMLADDGTFEPLFSHVLTADPLGFVENGKPYLVKVGEARESTRLEEAAICGSCEILGSPIILTVLDFRFMGASMGSVVGEKVTRSIEEALLRRVPLVVVSASGGARMHEGVIALMQMAKTSAALARLGSEGIPHIAVLTDPTSGGVSASFASLADITIAEPGAFVGFTGPRILEQITKQKLPPGIQTAEFVLEHGMIDIVSPRRELKGKIGAIIRLFSVCGIKTPQHASTAHKAGIPSLG